jgi:SAM-dependent methyltransferase
VTESNAKRATRALTADQLGAFDREYVHEERWQLIKGWIDRDFPTGRFRFIDIGGGNGVFADRLLQAYPNSSGTVLEPSNTLLTRNREHLRKRLVQASATELDGLHGSFDLAFLNWVLHHVVGDSYGASKDNIRFVLQAAARLLTPEGRLSVFENMYDGLLIDSLPGRLVYGLTSIRAIGSLVRRMGANTAGVGVCFQSEKQWREHMRLSGIEVRGFTRDRPFNIHKSKQWMLHARPIGPAHFWLAKK